MNQFPPDQIKVKIKHYKEKKKGEGNSKSKKILINLQKNNWGN